MTATTAAGSATVRMRVWVDFNGIDWFKKGLIPAVTDWWVPRKGDLVRLFDGEGNEMDGVVHRVKPGSEPYIHLIDVRYDMTTWESHA